MAHPNYSGGSREALLSQRQQAAGLVAVAVVGWAFPGVFVRLMPHLPFFPLVALRLSVAFAALLPFAISGKTRASVWAANASWRCWLLSLGMLAYYLTATPAFYYAPVGEVAMVIATAPLFAVILRLIGGRGATKFEIAGAILAILGVLIMAASAHHPTNGGAIGPTWLGIALAVTASIAAAAYAIGNRHLHQIGASQGAVAQTCLTFCLGVPLLPFLATAPHQDLVSPRMLWLIPLGAFSTALPTVAVAASAHRIPPVTVTMIIPLTAVFANVVAALVIGEIPTPFSALGGALVMLAVYIATRTERAHTE